MRKLIIAAFGLCIAGSVLAQGTVFFSDYGELGTTHVWGPSTTAPYISLQGSGSNDSPAGPTPYPENGMVLIGANGTGGHYGAATTFAQLLWANGAGQSESSLQPGGQTTTFKTGALMGRINAITDTIIGLIPDEAAATFEMVAWDNFSGLYPTWTQASVAWMQGLIGAAESGAFTVYQIGGSVNTSPDMLPPSFGIWLIPEPSTCVLTGLGLLGLLVFRRRNRN